MKKNTLKRTLKSGLALALMGVIATSSVACSLLPSSEEESAVTAQVESTVMAEEPTVIETIKIAEPADMLQVAPVEPENTYSPEPVTLSFFNESITTINEDGEEQTTIQKVISANVTPEGASVAFDWHVEWATNNEGAGAAVTDYLTVERVDGTINKATIIAHQIFPNSTIKVVATAKGTGVYGECIVSFVGLPTEIILTVMDDSAQPTTLFDEDWQTEVMYFSDVAKFSYSFDNPFHYIQEGYEPTFTFDAKLVGAYGFTIKSKDLGTLDPDYVSVYGEFVPTYDNGVLTSTGFYDAVVSYFGSEDEIYCYEGESSSSTTLNSSSFTEELAKIGHHKGEENFMGFVEPSYIILEGLNNFDYSCTISVRTGPLTSSYTEYIVEPCYRDNKLPYIELTISTGNATKTLNVRFGDEITGVDVNNGSVVL